MSNAIVPAARTSIAKPASPAPRYYDIIEAEYTLIHPRRSTIDDGGDDYAAVASAADGCAFGLLWIVVYLTAVFFAVAVLYALGSAAVQITGEMWSYLYTW